MTVMPTDPIEGTALLPELEVRPFQAEDATAWDAFVDQAPDACFFHRAGWPSVIAQTYGHKNRSLIAWRGSTIVGVAPFNHVKSPLFGSSLTSTAFTVGGGVLAADKAARDALGAAAAALGAELGVDHVECRSEEAQFEDWISKSELYAVFRKEFPADEDENLKWIPRKKRADVRKGIKSPHLAVDFDASVDEFYPLYAHSVHGLGTPVLPAKLIRNLKAAFGADMEICVVRGPDGPVAALVSFYFRDVVLPYYGGALPAARGLHAYDYMYWRAMRRAQETRDARIMDFGRSKRGTGAFDYKTYWGFEPKPLTYQFKLIKAKAAPDVNPLNPKYKLMTEGWRRMPLWAANRLGPIIASQIA